MLPDLLPSVASTFEPYLTLHRVHPSRTYNYAARGFVNLPVIEVEHHGPKCSTGESWIYIATPEGAALERLGDRDRLYVGAQTQDRMFRGDGLGGANYHHAEMRAGNGQDTPVAFLRTGRRIVIHRARAVFIASRIGQSAHLAPLKPLLLQPLTERRHLGWWFEQYVLYREPGRWRWNSARADKALAAAFAYCKIAASDGQ